MAKFFSYIAFDPDGMLSLSKWLSPNFHTIHNLEVVSVVFYSTKLTSSLYGGFSSVIVGQSVPKEELLVLLYD